MNSTSNFFGAMTTATLLVGSLTLSSCGFVDQLSRETRESVPAEPQEQSGGTETTPTPNDGVSLIPPTGTDELPTEPGGQEPGPGGQEPGENEEDPTDVIRFAEVEDILTQACSLCHGAGSAIPYVEFADYRDNREVILDRISNTELPANLVMPLGQLMWKETEEGKLAIRFFEQEELTE